MTALWEDKSQLIKKNENISAENIALGNAFADLAYDHKTLLDQKDEASDAEVTAMLEALRGHGLSRRRDVSFVRADRGRMS